MLDLVSGAPHGPFFGPLVAFARRAAAADDVGRGRAAADLAAFLRGDRLRKRTDDDCTLLLAVPWDDAGAAAPVMVPVVAASVDPMGAGVHDPGSA